MSRELVRNLPVVTLDVGGSKIAGNVVDENDELVLSEPVAVDTPSGARDPQRAFRKPSDVIDAMCAVATETAERAGIKPTAIGVSIPAPCLEIEGDVAFDCVNIWAFRRSMGGTPTNVRAALGAELGIPVAVENDANAFALGEYYFGAGRGHSHLLGVIYGTGVGSGIVADGRLLHSATWNAGEIHHIPLAVPEHLARIALGDAFADRMALDPSGIHARISLEELIRSSALARVFGDEPSKLDHDDPVRNEMIVFAAEWMAWGLAAALQTVSVPVVVIGGGLGEAFGDDLAAAIDNALRSPAERPLSSNYVAANGQVMISSLGACRAAFLGVAALARSMQTAPGSAA